MDPLAQRTVGRTGVQLTQLGCGGGPLGDSQEIIPEAQADATLEAAYDAGVRYFDTAPWYGTTKSEHRVGRILRTKPRDSFVLSTKVGRVFFRPKDLDAFMRNRRGGGLPFDLRFDYTRAGVMRSYEDSLMRLGLNTVDVLLIHDLDFGYHKTEEGVQERFDELERGGGVAALEELKRTGEIQAIGAGINQIGMIPRFLQRFDLDLFIVALPYTLLNQEALDQELALCAERGVAVVIGAVFASGILATGARGGGRYGYRPPEAAIVEKTERIEAICRRYGVPLGAAALQFPLGHPTVASVIPGPNHPDQVRQNVEWMRVDIPPALWTDLKAENLLHPNAPTP